MFQHRIAPRHKTGDIGRMSDKDQRQHEAQRKCDRKDDSEHHIGAVWIPDAIRLISEYADVQQATGCGDDRAGHQHDGKRRHAALLRFGSVTRIRYG